MLELLELQARARAIRSQLALEPVTKIEVDSDEEKRTQKEKKKSSKRDDQSNKNERKRFSSERESRDSAKLSRTNGLSDSSNGRPHADKEVEKITSRKIKLKRNYRSSENQELDEKNKEKETNGSKKAEKEEEKSREREKLVGDIKKEKRSRSPSPDVIPIVAEPETLLIADSSDEEKHLGTIKNPEEKAKALEEQSASQKEKNSNIKDSEKAEQDQENSSEQNHTESLSSTEVNKTLDNSTDDNPGSQTEISTEKFNDDDNLKYKQQKMSNKEKLKPNEATNSANHSEDDQNDDVISLGGDLENEMNEQLENEVNAMPSPYSKKPAEDSSQDNNKSQDDSQPEDVISLESSEDERPDDNQVCGNKICANASCFNSITLFFLLLMLVNIQSWHSRYMKSSKVSKVLAASRLGKRVRDRIKKTKHSKKATSNENSDAEKEKTAVVFSSKHEDGSVEQYKELLEIRQRKSS